jgi:hypothetical protein
VDTFQPPDDLEKSITVYYHKLRETLDEGIKGTSPVAQKNPDRAIYSGASGLAHRYRFVDVASFTGDWADLKLGDDELRVLEDVIARNPTRAPVVPGGGRAREIRRPDLSWEQGLRQPSPIARRFLDEIEMSPGHFRGRIIATVVDTGPSSRPRGSGSRAKTDPRPGH